MLEAAASDEKAWLTAEFQGSKDAPESLQFWPADYRIALSIELSANRLTVIARMENPDTKPLPFGLGYHPYFAVPNGAACFVSSPAQSMWELAENVPTGRVIAPKCDLRTPTPYSQLHLDDVYTGFGVHTANYLQGRVEWPGVGAMDLWVSPGFRELVAFTPPHRKAICLEPYTCTTDAVNLQARGIDAGWRMLAPGAVVMETVQYQFLRERPEA